MNARRLEFGLNVTCLVLASALAYELWAPLGKFDVPAVDLPAQPQLPSIAPFNPPPQAAYAAIDARPIFSPARKPIESTSVPGSAAAAAPPEVTLVGVILDGKTQLALVRRDGAPFAESLAVGASLDGWEVIEIAPDHVQLRSGTQDLSLSMDGRRKSQPVQPGSPTAPSPGLPAMTRPLSAKPKLPAGQSAQDQLPDQAGGDESQSKE